MLAFPETNELATAIKGFEHGAFLSLFEVRFPGRVKWIGFSDDFGVTFDGDTAELEQELFFALMFAKERPVIVANRFEVFLSSPACSFVVVSACYPAPECREDVVIKGRKDFLTDYMAMVGGPATQDRVKERDEFASRHLRVGFDECANSVHEFLDAPFRGLDE